jgi:ribosome biogenesis ATPase
LDALAPRRAGGENAVGERVVNQLLIELDGLDSRRDVFVIAATNRPDMIDSAMLRPGRLDKHLYVPLPDVVSRTSIILTAARKTPLAPDVDFNKIAADPRCSGYSGADLTQLVREASMEALQESFDRKDSEEVIPSVTMQHFHAALNKVNPSVSKADEQRYNALKKKLFSPRLRVDTEGNPVPPPSESSV